ncbi:hypothetical protein AB835_08470 [Candidatus Endobugula sertula]|uniref:Bifunctional NAD(P)H-hydrate repair enzyme n=1 Tax=Candidatus Endobugula sertula TaxID=62101 RepID=A0A1D2QPT9_9GAMM|nr:hypothetical protein AB835_08470 [Candidatus Endobugula sertula]
MVSTSDPSTISSGTSSLYLAKQVAEIDQYAITQLGIPGVVLMKRAGRYSFECLLTEWPETQSVHIVCGSGNNAGDGYVIAALAKQHNIEATIWSLKSQESLPDILSAVALAAYRYAQQECVECREFDMLEWTTAIAASQSPVIVDALLGIGAKGQLRDTYVTAIEAINASDCPVLAVDIPSGVNPNTGTVDSVAVRADVTVSFVGQKQGLYTGLGRVYSGERYFYNLGIPLESYERVKPETQMINYREWLSFLPERSMDAHKGHCGHVLIVGGDKGISYGYGGAPIMAAQMALRTGAGLVSLATRPEFVAAALMRQPEIMVTGIDNGQALLPMLERVSGIVIGPGLGRSSWSEQLFYHCISSQFPLVIDADALHLLAHKKFGQLPGVEKRHRQWILTPHPGEAAVLLECSVDEVQANRFHAAVQIQQQYGGVVVLKGAGTVVVTSTGEQWLCNAGNPGMASGGMGDVLSGLLGSLLVQGMTVNAAALLGVSLHALAADRWVEENGQRGLLATDLIPYVQLMIDGKVNG